MYPKVSYTITEAAEITGLTRPTIYKAIEEGALKVWRPWRGGNPRIHREWLEEWLGKPLPTAGETDAA